MIPLSFLQRLNLVAKWLLAGLFMLCLTLFNWSCPAQAANKINPQLEQEVLEVIRAHPEVILQSLQAYQKQQIAQIKQAQQALFELIKTDPKAVIAQSPTTGAADGKILLIEFSDFQCPYCADVVKTIKKFIANHQNDVTLVYKHFPLISIHPEAMSAAKAAWAAGEQGKFWEYHDALFSQQDKLGEQLYLDIAKKLNLNMDKFQRDRTLANDAIQEDIQLAQILGIQGTPSFVMNDKQFAGALQLSDIENIFAQLK